MGSSPVTATKSLPPSIARAVETALAPIVERDNGVLVAFSAGPDSTALLAAMAGWAPPRGVRLEAAHLDHRLDPDSPRRALRARAIAESLGVPLTLEVLEGPCPRGESLEAWARDRRYAFLLRLAEAHGLEHVATAHHRDDQAETLILRLSYGTGLVGLGGIRPRHGRIVRPLLELGREELERFVADLGLEPVRDPTNDDLDRPRNRIRHRLIPWLEADEAQAAAEDAETPGLVPRLAAVARRTRGVVERLDRRLATALRIEKIDGGARLDRRAFEALPGELIPVALAILAFRAGAPYPAAMAVRRELLRQLGAGGHVGCDVAGQWRIEADGRELRWLGREPSVGRFAYTGVLPGVVEVPELSLRIRLERVTVAPWMFEGRPDRAGFSGSLAAGTRITIRNRRPGDRIRPLGHLGERRLKELLIDHRVPRRQRDRLPLLLIDGKIAWVPGITIAHELRLDDGSSAWQAVIEDGS